MMLVTTMIRLFLSILLFRAALHKLRNRKIFQAELAAYRLVPHSLLQTSTVVFIATELLASISLLNLQSIVGPWLAAVLLILYASAMIINLLKGRSNIDCGCSGPLGMKKTISWPLVVRNVILTVLALACTMPVIATSLNALAIFVILVGATVSFFIYEAIEQAIANAQGYRRWRAQRLLKH